MCCLIGICDEGDGLVEVVLVDQRRVFYDHSYIKFLN